jgi:hypothetical protein
MTPTPPAPHQPSTAELVGGALKDAQELIGLQLEMFKAEVQADFQRTLRATAVMGAGLGLLFAGVILLAFTGAHLLHDMAPQLSLGTSLALTTFLTLALGGGLVYAAVSLFRSFNPLPDESAQSLQENVEWLTHRK